MVKSNIIRAKMAERGMSQIKLAELLNMTQTSLSNKINNKRDFKLREIIKMCEVFEIESNEEKANIFLS